MLWKGQFDPCIVSWFVNSIRIPYRFVSQSMTFDTGVVISNSMP